MRKFKKEVLPDDWLLQIDKFNVQSSSLSKNQKIIAKYLINNIKTEREKSLTNLLSRNLVRHIVFGELFLTSYYDDLPSAIIEDGFSETTGEKGLNLARKLHSLFVEFITYKDLVNKGYEIKNFIREEGSCDLKLIKGNQLYNFEVKFKESEDVRYSRLYDYIEGYSLLLKNKFLRDKSFIINLKTSDLNYSTVKKILSEIDVFINKKNDIFNGAYIQIFNKEKSHLVNRDVVEALKYNNRFFIKKITNIDELIKTLFIENNGHISKLIDKSHKFEKKDNYTGYLAWSIPFHVDIDMAEIEKSLNQVLDLNFDLFVYLGGIGKDEHKFIVTKKT